MCGGRWNITTLTRADLIPLLCRDCGLRLSSDAEAVIFVCPVCGLAHEPVEGRLEAFSPLIASVTTRGTVSASPRYLAVWRLAMVAGQGDADTWPRMSPGAPHRERYLFVPAFSLSRVVVENLGVRLTQKRPVLEPAPGPLSPDGGGSAGSSGLFSPVVLGRREARLLGEFVHLGLTVREGRHEEAVDDQPETLGEELIYIPAVWDPRCVHDANWRLLLREFDD